MTEAAPGPDSADPGRADPDRADPGRAVFRLIYRSRDLIPLDTRKTELGTLFSEARSNNKKQDITGALLVHGDWFAQVLEGSEAPIRTLFARIEQDGRHDNVSVIASGPAERVFGRWSMARVSADGEPDIPMIAHRDGIAPAAGRGTTAAQEAVLDVLRQATKDDAHAV
jgi:Sensors of blue-light using FAD